MRIDESDIGAIEGKMTREDTSGERTFTDSSQKKSENENSQIITQLSLVSKAQTQASGKNPQNNEMRAVQQAQELLGLGKFLIPKKMSASVATHHGLGRRIQTERKFSPEKLLQAARLS